MKTNLLTRAAAILMTTATIILFGASSITAQSTYKISAGNVMTIKVSGSSNIHDWTMTSSAMQSHGDFKFDASHKLLNLNAFTFDIASKSLKSGKSSMDNRTYTAMKADKHPQVLYKLTSAVITQVQKDKYIVKSIGDLTIAGTTQSIAMDLTIVVNPDNSITCTGSEKLKLTDYNIKPPSYMLGAMKVGNDLTINFNLQYKK